MRVKRSCKSWFIACPKVIISTLILPSILNKVKRNSPKKIIKDILLNKRYTFNYTVRD